MSFINPTPEGGGDRKRKLSKWPFVVVAAVVIYIAFTYLNS